ncbi:MAG: hypothetical protein LUG16_08640, partial [Candidatus Gastranaerophilales bacterium]|nr:hypothetical protein [Candidatus Gastranaerophilales bacterium]
NLLSSNIKDVGGMVDDSTYAFELKPHAKDFDNIDNLLNCIKENKEKIKLIFDNKTSLESYVTNSTGDKKTTSITVITAALL